MDAVDAALISDIGYRLDRLPMTSAHRATLVAMSIAYFFELSDLNEFSFAAPGVIAQWHIPVGTVAVVIAALFGGMFVGAAVGGWIADRHGRRSTLIVATLFYGVSSLCTAVAWNWEILSLARFATGIGIGGIAVTATVYIGELFPARMRGRFTALAFTIGVIGIPVTAGVSRLVVPMAPWGWRLVFVWGAIGLLDAVLIARLQESPRWLAARGHAEEARRAVARLEAIAVAEHGSLAPVATPELPPPVIEIGRAAYRTLFQRAYRGRTTLFCSLWVLQTFGLYGFSAWVPTLLVKEGVSLVHTLTYSTIMTIASPIGALLAMQLPGGTDRKWFVVFAAALIATFGLIYGTSLTPAVILVFGFLVSCMLQFFAVVIYTYTPEHFPTSIRSSGMGFTYGIGRLANVFGPFLISWIYTGFGYKSVFGCITGCWIAIAFIAAFLGPRSFDVRSPVRGKVAAATN